MIFTFVLTRVKVLELSVCDVETQEHVLLTWYWLSGSGERLIC